MRYNKDMKNLLCFLFVFAFTLPAMASTQSESINKLLKKNVLETESIKKTDNSDYIQTKAEWCGSIKKQWGGGEDNGVYFDYSTGQCVTPQAHPNSIYSVSPIILY